MDEQLLDASVPCSGFCGIGLLLGYVCILSLQASAFIQHSTWLGSLSDFPDAALISSAAAQGISGFLSEDADLATFSGITLYTANRNVINAARTAGKLV